MVKRLFTDVILTLSLLFTASLLPYSVLGANDRNETIEGVEILQQGPVHEAFAGVNVNQTWSSNTISYSPPEPINEIPPDHHPTGQQVEWIAGYWSWDDEKEDFIWISGIWRDVPPGRQWVPGYWVSTGDGYNYVSGYWYPEEKNDLTYLPQPPEPREIGPSHAATSSSHEWLRGNWIWYQHRYVWQPGYWFVPSSHMVWVPAHYVWTPRGYIYVSGYWDYHFHSRGVIFAPRYYGRTYYRSYSYYYTPRCYLDTSIIFLSLFIRKDSHHYYYGNYHNHWYKKHGYHPWYSKHATRHGYDPYYKSYRNYRLRYDKNWEYTYYRKFKRHHAHYKGKPYKEIRTEKKHHLKYRVKEGRIITTKAGKEKALQRAKVVKTKIRSKVGSTPNWEKRHNSKKKITRVNRSTNLSKSSKTYNREAIVKKTNKSERFMRVKANKKGDSYKKVRTIKQQKNERRVIKNKVKTTQVKSWKPAAKKVREVRKQKYSSSPKHMKSKEIKRWKGKNKDSFRSRSMQHKSERRQLRGKRR